MTTRNRITGQVLAVQSALYIKVYSEGIFLQRLVIFTERIILFFIYNENNFLSSTRKVVLLVYNRFMCLIFHPKKKKLFIFFGFKKKKKIFNHPREGGFCSSYVRRRLSGWWEMSSEVQCASVFEVRFEICFNRFYDSRIQYLLAIAMSGDLRPFLQNWSFSGSLGNISLGTL